MFQDRYLDKIVGEKIKRLAEEKEKAHVSSGKLSASMLGMPTQWQVLKMIGVRPVEIDEYVLRKFKRGNDVEDWLIQEMPGVVEKQKEANYRGCIGFIDAVVDSTGYNLECGIIPHEIKSVSNAKYKRITKDNKADVPHMLQAGMYALAMGTEHFAIDYVATDDLRIETFVYKTSDIASAVNESIDAFNNNIRSGVIPDFMAKEKWQTMPNYCNYPEWLNLSSEESMKKILGLPQAHQKLISFKENK